MMLFRRFQPLNKKQGQESASKKRDNPFYNRMRLRFFSVAHTRILRSLQDFGVYIVDAATASGLRAIADKNLLLASERGGRRLTPDVAPKFGSPSSDRGGCGVEDAHVAMSSSSGFAAPAPPSLVGGAA